MNRTRQQLGVKPKLLVERTPLDEALRRILEKLERKDRVFTESSLGQEARLNRRTVEKVLEMLTLAQSTFERAKLMVKETRQAKLVTLEPKSGILGLPEQIQRLIIRTVFFPEPDEQQRTLVHLYIRGAVSKQTAVSLDKSSTIEKLLKQGQVVEENQRFHLSDEGIIVAKGSLDLYPELKDTIALFA